MLMAGRVAEKRVKGANSGAISDLESATNVAKAMVMHFCLSSINSNRYFDQSDFFMITEEKKEQLNNEIQSLLDEGYKRAERILSENEYLLKVIAEQLVKQEILTGAYLDKIVRKYKKHRKKICEEEMKKSIPEDTESVDDAKEVEETNKTVTE